jgi:hypothetical protein
MDNPLRITARMVGVMGVSGVISLKGMLACLSLLIAVVLVAACASSPQANRSSVVEYLKAYDQIDNDLTDTYNEILGSLAG